MNVFGILFRDGYLQTWPLAVRTRHIPVIGEWMYASIRSACQKLCGHEPSKTEWGYGVGNNHADVWCRWCNQIGQIPLTETTERFETARGIIWQATRCDINHISDEEAK